MTEFRLCAVIPAYNHVQALPNVIAALRQLQIKVYVIDDGSQPSVSESLGSAGASDSGVIIHRLSDNMGKGYAVMQGLALAWRDGFSHALQIDADGQHDTRALPDLIQKAVNNPNACITGYPIYNQSAPMGRRIGRWITHVWVWIETLSLHIKDTMCGFRIYPIAPTMALINKKKIGTRMDFDTEIMVRLYWRGVDIQQIPVHVIYPKDNTSNFKLVRDNWQISRMHTRLFFEMLFHIPSVWRRGMGKSGVSTHWASLNERGTYWGLLVCTMFYRVFGRYGCSIFLSVLVVYFLLTATEQRQASRQFLARVLERPPRLMDIYKHFYQFALRALDVLVAWNGDVGREVVHFREGGAENKFFETHSGGLIIVSHFGNSDLARILLDKQTRDRFLLLVHTQHAVNYNRSLARIHPDAAMNMVQVGDIGPETILKLQDHISHGGYVVIAGDRPPISGDKNVSVVRFFGDSAPFAQGPWILASLLATPVFFLFCYQKENKTYELAIEQFVDRVNLPRSHRQNQIEQYCQSYAERLEYYVRQYPFQWFNFFDFWRTPE